MAHEDPVERRDEDPQVEVLDDLMADEDDDVVGHGGSDWGGFVGRGGEDWGGFVGRGGSDWGG